MDIAESIEIEKRLHYIASMRPLLNKRALFSDTTSDYVSPLEPKVGDEVTIKFRSARNNIDFVNVISNLGNYSMDKKETVGDFDFYEVTIPLDRETLNYHFEIKVGKVVCYYNAKGVTREIQDYYDFRVIPGFSTPDWAKGAVMYQIYVDRFCNGDPTNDVETREYVYLGDYSQKVTDWEKNPAQMGVREFYGGDLQGVLDKMDYLENLGIDVIYFNPLFVSPSNHKYDIQDYDYIDPHIGKIVSDKGELLNDEHKENQFASKYINRVANKANLEASNRLFAQVVQEAHKRGMKVIMDGVFNHCGSFNKWLDRERIYEGEEGYLKGAFIDKNSPYTEYFRFFEDKWPNNTTYDGWWGHDTLPKLNYEGSNDLYKYILHIGQKWVSPPFNADGWRLDVAADLGHSPEFNHRFWKDFRQAVKEANPNALILAEHYGSSRDWLKGDEWDTVMNYDAFMEPVTWFLTGMQKHSDDYREDLLGNADSFWGAMNHHGTNFTEPSRLTSMNELSNHDHSRFLTRTNHKVGRIHTLGSHAAEEDVKKCVLREAVVMQMTWPGAPTIYYGDEAGVCGFTDPDNRRTYPWGKEDTKLIEFHRDMIKIHKSREEILKGSLREMAVDYNFTAYARFNRKSQTIVAVNNNFYEYKRTLSVWETGAAPDALFRRVMLTTENDYTIEEETFRAADGKLEIVLPPFSAIVLVSDAKEEINAPGKADVHEVKPEEKPVIKVPVAGAVKEEEKKEQPDILPDKISAEAEESVERKIIKKEEKPKVDDYDLKTEESPWDMASKAWKVEEDKEKKHKFPFFK